MKKFDFAIGNPPYQEEAPGESTSDKPIYHYFLDAAFKVAYDAELITPGRFLFNAGATPKDWNAKMLNDPHVKVMLYNENATELFPGTAITGGIAVTYHSQNKLYEPIGVFIPYEELRGINTKIHKRGSFVPISTIISGRTPYLFTEKMHTDNPSAKDTLSKGHMWDISSNAFTSLPDVFRVNVPIDQKGYLRVLGRLNNSRAYCWIKKEYAKGRMDDYIGKWKVFLPKANGASGMLGKEAARLISKPVVGLPNDIATDTFIVVGPFENENTANSALKYLNTKFARVMLGTLKVTQINSKETWNNVPLQDFTSSSDIDWSMSVAGIDRQLYVKYGLSEEEINFIETHVQEMK